MICRRKGYPLKVVMPDNVTEERTQLLRMYGAEIVYSEGAKGSNGAVELALEMAEADSSYYMPYQYGNEANPRAHYDGTAPEILEELDEVAAFVGGLGTGGTLMGVGRRLKEHDPETKIVAAEPMQGELVQGLRSLDDGFIPPIIDLSVLDRKIMVSNRDAIVWTKRLLTDEGMFAGVSTGAIAAIAVRIAARARRGQRRLRRARRRLEVPLLGRLHEADRGARGRRLHRLVVAGAATVDERRSRGSPRDYEPPTFDHVPDPDAALFLCAVDHRTGYREPHIGGGGGPVRAAAPCCGRWRSTPPARDARAADGAAPRDVTAREVAELLPDRRRDRRRPGPPRGAVARPRRRAASATTEARRGPCSPRRAAGSAAMAGCWRCSPATRRTRTRSRRSRSCSRRSASAAAGSRSRDPEQWEVCADNVLMRLALRSGLVEPGGLAEVRAATRDAFKQVAERSGVPPPVLDDLLWELGRDDPDLLGAEGGDLREPPRDPDSAWY